MNATTSPSNTRQVARAAGLVMVLFVASRTMGLLREMVIARQFGTSAELDAYLAAFRLPDLFFALMAGGALQSDADRVGFVLFQRRDGVGLAAASTRGGGRLQVLRQMIYVNCGKSQ